MTEAIKGRGIYTTLTDVTDFEEYLLSPHAFNELKAGGLPLPVEPDGERYLERRLDLLREELAKVNALVDQGALPDATFSKGGLEGDAFDQPRPRGSGYSHA